MDNHDYNTNLCSIFLINVGWNTSLQMYLVTTNKTGWELFKPGVNKKTSRSLHKLARKSAKSRPIHDKQSIIYLVNEFIKDAQSQLPYQSNSYYNIITNNSTIQLLYTVIYLIHLHN